MVLAKTRRSSSGISTGGVSHYFNPAGLFLLGGSAFLRKHPMKIAKSSLIAVLALAASTAVLAEPTRSYTEAGGAVVKVNERGLVAVIQVDMQVQQVVGGALVVSDATAKEATGTGQSASN